MREPAPAVFPVFRSRITAALLARVYIGDGEYSVADLAKAAQTDTGTTAREVRRLESAGVVRSRMVGRTKLVRADREAPFYRPLRDLVVITLGPADVLGEEQIGIDGYQRPGDTVAHIFAARLASIRHFTSKPVYIAETSVAPSPDQARQIIGLFHGVQRFHLSGFVWFDINRLEAWRLEGRPAAVRAFRRAVVQTNR